MPERQIRVGDRVTMSGTVAASDYEGYHVLFDGCPQTRYLPFSGLALATIEPRLLTPEEVIARKRENPEAKIECQRDGSFWMILHDQGQVQVLWQPGWQFREVEESE